MWGGIGGGLVSTALGRVSYMHRADEGKRRQYDQLNDDDKRDFTEDGMYGTQVQPLSCNPSPESTAKRGTVGVRRSACSDRRAPSACSI